MNHTHIAVLFSVISFFLSSPVTAQSQERPRIEQEPTILWGGASGSEGVQHIPPDVGCSLDKARAVGLRGFRLGMTVDAVKARVPGIRVRAVNQIGGKEAEVYWFNRRQIRKLDFKGVEAIKFVFLDNRLVEIVMMYDRSVKWGNGDELVKKVAEALGLPASWVRHEGERTQLGEVLRTLRCGDDVFKAGVVLDEGVKVPLVTWYDLSTRKVIAKRVADEKERRRRLEEKEREKFKP